MTSKSLEQPSLVVSATRVSTSSRFSVGSLVRRPETGSLLGLVAVFTFFWIFGGSNFASATGAASWLNVAAGLGIVALPIGLLMIAGELDISIGSMIPASSMTIAIVSGHFHQPIMVGIGASLALGAIVGFVNGFLVVRTAVPSFIVTLGTLFAVAGLTLGLSVILTGTTSARSLPGRRLNSCWVSSSAASIR
jgi:simple sugar transport system permease protein